MSMNGLTTASQSYMVTFGSYINQFLHWGQWLFFGLLFFNIIWLCLWYAFDRDSFSDSMGQFIKKFFVIAFFYTIMLHHEWLISLLNTSQTVGSVLTGAKTDPSSIISQGIGIANKIIQPVEASSLLTFGLGELIAFVVYVVILFVYISIALQLAVTLIITTALIVVSTFFLGFAALASTMQIARNTLDVILSNCVKLMGIYLVVAAGTKTITDILPMIPVKVINFDAYAWVISVALLFWLLAKNLPEQLAKLVSGIVQDTQGHSAAAMAISAVQYASIATKTAQMASEVAGSLAKSAGNTISNIKQKLSGASPAPHGIGSSANAAGSSATDATRSTGGSVSEHFSELASKRGSGQGSASVSSTASSNAAASEADLPAFLQRQQNTNPTQTAQPRSSGRAAAGSSQLRSSSTIVERKR